MKVIFIFWFKQVEKITFPFLYKTILIHQYTQQNMIANFRRTLWASSEGFEGATGPVSLEAVDSADSAGSVWGSWEGDARNKVSKLLCLLM